MGNDPNQLHVKFYFWCLDVWDAFLRTRTSRRMYNQCQYIRTILIWMPLALIVNVAFWVYAFYVLVYFPFIRFGAVGSGVIYLMVVFVFGVILFCAYVKEKLEDRWCEYCRAVEQDADFALSDVTAAGKQKRDPGFFKTIWAYLVAAKQRICLTVELKDERTQKEDA